MVHDRLQHFLILFRPSPALLAHALQLSCIVAPVVRRPIVGLVLLEPRAVSFPTVLQCVLPPVWTSSELPSLFVRIAIVEGQLIC